MNKIFFYKVSFRRISYSWGFLWWFTLSWRPVNDETSQFTCMWGESPVTYGYPSHRANNAESVSMSWRRNDNGPGNIIMLYGNIPPFTIWTNADDIFSPIPSLRFWCYHLFLIKKVQWLVWFVQPLKVIAQQKGVFRTNKISHDLRLRCISDILDRNSPVVPLRYEPHLAGCHTQTARKVPHTCV